MFLIYERRVSGKILAPCSSLVPPFYSSPQINLFELESEISDSSDTNTIQVAKMSPQRAPYGICRKKNKFLFQTKSSGILDHFDGNCISELVFTLGLHLTQASYTR